MTNLSNSSNNVNQKKENKIKPYTSFDIHEFLDLLESGKTVFYKDCIINFQIDLSNYNFCKKVRFHNCVFKKDVICTNTTFNSLVDFYQSTFESNQYFHLTDFLNISIFTEVRFEKAVIFRHNKVSKNTYISFEKAIFKNGLDISNSNFWCTLQVYGIKVESPIPDNNSLAFYLEKSLGNINEENDLLKKKTKEDLTDDEVRIKNLEHRKYLIEKIKPITFENKKNGISYIIGNYNSSNIEKELRTIYNKDYLLNVFKETHKGIRESYRRIKQEFRKNENNIEALDFHHHELTIFKKELVFKERKALKNKAILYLNKISNDFNRNWLKGFVFSILVAVFFFSTSSLWYLSNDRIVFSGVTLNEFINYVNPLNWKHSLYGVKDSVIILWLYIGKLMIGYGYYQTIQAFRKYGKN